MSDAKSLYEYYNKGLYPFELIHRILTFNRANQSGEARTIALKYPGDENVYATYDYKRDTVQALRARMLASKERPPESLHLGVFRENFGNKIVRGKKELVFDLDITDFERYCLCRSIKRLCPTCWIQMQGASLILDHILETNLGYKEANRLWIFSGGKGLHCFVNAAAALNLDDKERSQLYKRLFIGRDDDSRMAAFVKHVCAQYPEFVKSLAHFFQTHMIKEANIFALEAFLIRDDPPLYESFETFCLRHLRLHHPALAHLIRGTWESITSSDGSVQPEKKVRMSENISTKKWQILQQLEEMSQNGAGYKPSLFIMFRLLYPMIDEKPLKIGQKIKLPFSIHGKSTNIALPLTQESIMKMDIRKDILPLSRLFEMIKQSNILPQSFIVGKKLLEQWINVYPV